MRKFLVAILTLLALVVSGCGGSGKPKSPLPSHTYSGEPTDVVVTVKRSEAPAIAPMSMQLMDAKGETQTLNVTIYKGNTYRIHRQLEVEPGFEQTALEMIVPSDQGYSVAAILVDGDRLIEAGRQAGVNAPDGIETMVSLPIGTPEYTLHKPDQMYSGGDLGQFSVSLAEHLRHILYESYIYFGLSEWTSLNEFYALYDAKPRQGWLGGNMVFLPEFTQATHLYYQVSICALPGYFGDDRPCFFFPAMGEPLPHIMVYPSPDWTD